MQDSTQREQILREKDKSPALAMAQSKAIAELANSKSYHTCSRPPASSKMTSQILAFLLMFHLALSVFASDITNQQKQQILQAPTARQPLSIIKRHNQPEKDFPPKLVHEPHSVQLEAHKPHTIECPIESKPESEVKWFKDDQLLISEPPHLEQSGSELMFFSVDQADSGDYHCQASNYLGSVTSGRFRLSVGDNAANSSAKTLPPQLEPVANVATLYGGAKFTCTIPLGEEGVPGRPDVAVGWRKNGKRIDVASVEDVIAPAGNYGEQNWPPVYLEERKSATEYELIVRSVQLQDDNATFTCYLAKRQDPESADDTNESNRAQLFIKPANNATAQQIPMDVHWGPPVEDLLSRNRTSKLPASQVPASLPPTTIQRPRSLGELLADAWELAKPTPVLLGLLSLLVCVFGLQVLVLRRRPRENKYMKHQAYAGSGASANSGVSGGSGASSALGGSLADCDPVFSSLLQRTLSAPNGNLLAGKKSAYRSYRDHLRKVVDSGDRDLIDGPASGAFFPSGQVDAFNLALPDLYNQSLAAREQARSLLQASEHMRSLNNLSHKLDKPQQQNQMRFKQQQLQQQQGSHLNLPLSFNNNFDQNRLLDGPAQLMASTGAAFWPPHSAAGQLLSRHQTADSEHYQLVNCNSSSNSSSSSGQPESRGVGRGFVSSMDHYSTIDNVNADEENRYEELEGTSATVIIDTTPKQQQQTNGNRCSSSFVTLNRSSNQQPARSSFNSNCSSSGRGTSSTVSSEKAANRQSSRDKAANNKLAPARGSQYPDQLSPYAVSSICNQQRRENAVNPNEAMRALNEQFNINQLMLLDEQPDANLARLPFDPPPPPPPPAAQ